LGGGPFCVQVVVTVTVVLATVVGLITVDVEVVPGNVVVAVVPGRVVVNVELKTVVVVVGVSVAVVNLVEVVN